MGGRSTEVVGRDEELRAISSFLEQRPARGALLIEEATSTERAVTSRPIGADGHGLISYGDITNGDLKVAHCSNTFCVPFFRRR